jgi:integrase
METRALTRKEVTQILDSTSSLRDKALLTFGFNCGYRISEILSLKISDVVTTIANGVLKVKSVIVVGKENMKGKRKARAIRLNSTAQQAVKALAKSLIEKGLTLSDPLFGGRKKRGKTAITRITAWRIIKALALKVFGDDTQIGTHSMRKSFATHLYLATSDIYRVSASLGHSFVSTTERYIKDSLSMISLENLEFSLT